MKHHPNCAVVRSGDLKAWCDCAIGERHRVVERLRYGVKEFRSLAEVDPKWELVAEILKEEADVIENNEH
jgi:hypothetical protein